jgi:acyl-CoA synthetase (AMP-forming)/AMP-acid ligase II
MTTIIASLNEYFHSDRTWYFPEKQSVVSAKTLCCYIDQVALQLRIMGIQPGDRVGLLLNNSLVYVVLLYAIWVNRAITVPLQAKMAQDSDYPTYLEYFHQVCDMRLLFFDNPQLQKPLGLWRDDSGVQIFGTGSLELTDDPVEKPLRLETDYPKELTCLLQFSSGTTGRPKAVEVTHKMIMAQMEALLGNQQKYAIRSQSRPDMKLANWLPFSHNLGLFVGVLYPVFSQSNNTVVSPQFFLLNPVAWFSLLSEREIQVSFFTNSSLAMALRHLANLEASELDLSSLQLYLGGEKISPVVIRRAEEILGRFNFSPEQIHLGYGLSENSLSATSSKAGPIQTHYFLYGENNQVKPAPVAIPGAVALCSIGEANHDCVITIRDEEGKVLPDLTIGEMHIEGPCVMEHYFRNPLQTAVVLEERRLKTGDLAFSYNEEFFYHSRKDDLVIIGGRNFVPDDCELAVENLDFVPEGGSALIMVEDEKTGQNKAVLLYETAEDLSPVEKKEQCKTIQKVIYNSFDLLVNTVVNVAPGEIEKTATGKKRRKVIKARYRNFKSQ